MVIWHNLPGYGFKGKFTIVQPIRVVVRYGGEAYDVQLTQLAKKGPGGAWYITSIARHTGAVPPPPIPKPGAPPTPVPNTTPRLGTVTQSPSIVRAVQEQVTAGNKAYAYYLNPVGVVERNLGKYGFTLPVPIVEPLVITVTYRGKQYDILLTQPVNKGVLGIWLTREIRLHR